MRKFTEQQQRVIDHREGNLLVSAAAGSGKTTVLVERIVQMLLDKQHPVSIDELLVVTFTNSAAASMKSKVEERLKAELEHLQQIGAPEEEREYIASQIRLAPLSSMMTNHSFSLQLVKEHVTRIEGLDPGMRVADETESQLLKMDVIHRVMEEFYSSALSEKADESSREFIAFADNFKDSTNTDSLEQMLLKIYNFMLSAPDPRGWLSAAVDGLDPDHEGADSLIGLGIEDPGNEKRLQSIRELLTPAMKGLKRVLFAFDEAYHRAKLEKNLIDFEDFEHYALKILEDPAVCKAVREQYRYIFIDEYQDCNLLQETIIDRIARKNEEGQNINVFMVGDVKQSIYQFRMAEPSLFQEKYSKYGQTEGTDLMLLNTNFRSESGVINGVNDVFSALMRREVGGIEYGPNEALHSAPGKPEAEEGKPCVRLIVEKVKGKDDQRRAVAIKAAEEIQRLILEEGYIAGDIVILERSRTNADKCREELAKRKIPMITKAVTPFYETTEVKTVVSFLKVIDNPHQDIPLAGVLVSPIGGMDDDDLGYIRLTSSDGDLYDCLKIYGERGAEGKRRERVCGFLKKLERFRSLSARATVHDLLWSIYLETGYYLFVSAMPGGRNRQENLETLLEKSLEFEKGMYSGLYQFLRYVEQSAKAGIKQNESIGDEKDAVRCTTIHDSKGLEFKIVFVIGLGENFNEKDSRRPVIMHKKYGLGADMRDSLRNVKCMPVKKDFIKNRILEEMKAEEIRLLYVAMTRAEEKLYLLGGREPEKPEDPERSFLPLEDGRLSPESILKASNMLQWVESIIRKNHPSSVAYEVWETESSQQELVSITESRNASEQSGSEVVLSEKERETLKNKLTYTYPNRWRTRVPQVLSVSAVKHARMEETAKALEADGGTEEVSKAFFVPSENGDPTWGALRGTAFHEVMAAGKMESLADPVLREKEIQKLVEAHLLTKEEADSIDRRWIERFAESDLYSRLMEVQKEHPERIHKEQSFVLNLRIDELKEMSEEFDYGEGGEERIIMQGIIDLWIEEEDGIVLADYKTDGVLDEARIAGYGVQLSIYQRALEEAFGVKVKEKMLYDVRRGKEIRC